MGGNGSKCNDHVNYLQQQLAAERNAREQQANEAAENERRLHAMEEIKRRLEEEKKRVQEEVEHAEKIRQEQREDELRREQQYEKERVEAREDRLRKEDLEEKLRVDDREDRLSREAREEEARRRELEEKTKQDEHLRKVELGNLQREYEGKERDKDREHEKWKIAQEADRENKQMLLKIQVIEMLMRGGFGAENFERILRICLDALHPANLSLMSTATQFKAISEVSSGVFNALG